MLATVQSCAIEGLEGVPVAVEVDVSRRMAGKMTLVGLPDAAVRESLERVRAAVLNSGCYFTRQRLTINLAPADIRKVGPVYDLPIAVGLLLATGQVVSDLDDAMFIGELSLDGRGGESMVQTGRGARGGSPAAPSSSRTAPAPPSRTVIAATRTPRTWRASTRLSR
jgi:hypothetical protein